MSDVFISYAHSTARHARAAAEALRGLGYSVWLDDDLPAHRAFAAEIEAQLTAAKAALVIWSQEAARSDWVLSEANRAREAHKLVQLRVDPARLPMPFDQIQCADLSGWSGETAHPAWGKVAASVADLVKGNDRPRAASAPVLAAAPPPEPLLAVLAFDNLSGDPEMAYFSDGVSEEIRETVARGADLKVIGRASSFQFRGPDKAAANVAAQLGATHILDGSVRRSGQRVRISTDLVQCAAATTLWSERFDRELTDIFALQDEIAAAVAQALKRAFAPAAPVGAIDPATYDLYLRTRAAGYGVAIDEQPRIDALRRVTAAAPGLAPAWALLALALARRLRSRRQGDRYEPMRAEVVEAAETALRLDAGQGLAHTALAYLEPWSSFAAREALLVKAAQAAPDDPDCLVGLFELHHNTGRFRQAIATIEHAHDVDPLHTMAAFWWSAAAKYEEGGDRNWEWHRRFQAFRARWPQEVSLGAGQAIVAAVIGEWAQFEDSVREMRARGGLPPAIERSFDFYASLRNATAETRDSLRRRLDQQVDRTGTVQFLDLIAAYQAGLKEDVFAIIERASFAHLSGRDGPSISGIWHSGIMFAVSPTFDFACDVRFLRLCAKMGLCDFWVETDQWPNCADEVPYDFRAEARRLAASVRGPHVVL